MIEKTKPLITSVAATPNPTLGATTVTLSVTATDVSGVSAGVLFAITATPAARGVVGPLSNDDVKNLRKGLLYLNFHTDVEAGGEIRGQILPAAPSYKPLSL